MTPNDRSAGKRLCNRLVAIREEAKKPARSFNLDWQLGRLLDEMERTFGIRSSELDALIEKRCYGCRSMRLICKMRLIKPGRYMCTGCDRLANNMAAGV